MRGYADVIYQTLSRPGGNITGVSYTAPEAAGKLVQLISELVPSIRRVVVLWNKANHAKVLEMGQVTTAGRILGIDITSLDFSDPNDYATAFNQIPHKHPDALIVLSDPVTWDHRQAIADFALKQRLPTIYAQRTYVEPGGLISYGMEERAIFRRVAAAFGSG